MIKTQTGRVVYDRPRHFFSGRDLFRIARAMPPPETFEDGIDRLQTIEEVYADIVQGLLNYVFGRNLGALVSFVLNFFSRTLEAMLRSVDLDETDTARLMRLLETIGSL